jgi:membrane dipeptidase
MQAPALRMTGLLALVAATGIACAPRAPAPAPESSSARVQRLLRESPLVDGHNDLMFHFHACRDGCPRGPEAYDISSRTRGHTDIPRWRQGGLGAQLLNAGGTDDDNPTLEGTLKGLAFARALVSLHSGDLRLAYTSAQVRAAHKAGLIAIVLSLEHPGRLGEDERTVEQLAEAGLRANILAYNAPTELADGHAGPARHGGLSAKGRMMVGWMQRHGILVDLSHASADTARDTLDLAAAPVIFSHSSAAALCDVSRNVPDDVLRKLPGNGGLVMVSFVPEFTSARYAEWQQRGDVYWEKLMKELGGDRARVDPLMKKWEQDNPAPAVSISEVADHVEHIRRIAGIDHVGLGGDFDGIDRTVSGLEDVAGYPRLLEELVRRGWGDEELRKLAGGNFLRVLDAADAVKAAAGVKDQPARPQV